MTKHTTLKPHRKNRKNQHTSFSRDVLRVFMTVSNIGFVMVFCILVCLALGIYLDKIFQKDYTFVIVFLIIGIIAGFYQCYQILKKELKL